HTIHSRSSMHSPASSCWRTSACTSSLYFFFNDTATTEIYTLSLHDALPICQGQDLNHPPIRRREFTGPRVHRSEEHTSELQSHSDLVCRLLLENKEDQH